MSEISKKIELSYINYVLSHNSRPKTINDLISKELEDEKDSIIESFKDLELIEIKIWQDGITQAFEHSNNDPNYEEYSVREKLLSFFYNYMEVLKKDNKFYEYSANIHSVFELTSIYERSTLLKNVFSNHIKKILNEGFATGEVQERFFISDYYDDIIYIQTLGVIKYALNDQSEEKENTDELIEKSVNLIMDLLEPNFTDSAFLFAKFLFQK